MRKNNQNNISDLFITRLRCLDSMYQVIIEDAKKRRSEQLNKDWIEWEALDSESRHYVLNYLSKKEEKK